MIAPAWPITVTGATVLTTLTLKFTDTWSLHRTPSVTVPMTKHSLFIPTAHTLPLARSVRCSAARSLGTAPSQIATISASGL